MHKKIASMLNIMAFDRQKMNVLARAPRRVAASLILLVQLLVPFSALAQSQANIVVDSSTVVTDNVKATLVSRTTHVFPGQMLDLALVLDAKEGWHTYWKNPGDTGLPTVIDWELPDGFKPGDIQWPVPERINYEGLINFGFHGESWLLVPVAVPFDNVDINGDAIIKAQVKWLVCGDVCIPEQGTFELRLPLAPFGAVMEDYYTDWKAGFNKAWAETPQLLLGEDAEYTIDSEFRVRLPGDSLPVFSSPPQAFVSSKQLISNETLPEITIYDGDVWIIAQPDPYIEEPPEFTTIVLSWDQDNEVRSLEIPVSYTETLVSPFVAPVSATEMQTASGGGPGLLQILVFAILGGLILNAMPCVFPVLSLKVIGLIEGGAGTNAERRMHGLSYAAGVIVSFVIIAAVLILLRGAGQQLGWGFQLQSALFIGALVYLLFFLGLSLSGFIEIGSSLQNVGGGLVRDSHSMRGSFFTGVLAAVVATPCTAPFMATAVGYALSQSAIVSLTVFVAMGFGLSLPFLLIAFVPALAGLLPRPGNWMVKFKEALAFPMYLTVVWLLWVFARQVGVDAAALLLVGMVCISFAVWLWDATLYDRRKLVSTISLVVAIILAAVLLVYAGRFPSVSALGQENSSEQAASGYIGFTPQALEAARSQHDVVLVNMTADWCITCKVNERVALKSSAVELMLKAEGTAYVKGDWTNADPAITSYLASFDRSGVPLYVVYKKGEEPQVLPQILTPDIVVEALK